MADHNLEAERAAFEASGVVGRLYRNNTPGSTEYYEDSYTELAWRVWQEARRAPAVGEDGLPPLPAAAVEFVCYEETDTADFLQVAQVLEEGPLYTAEQVRQAQRDAVAADRLARGAGSAS